MNEIQLAQMADRLQKLAGDEGVRAFVTTSGEISQREADLVNEEMAKRGGDLRVVLASSFRLVANWSGAQRDVMAMDERE